VEESEEDEQYDGGDARKKKTKKKSKKKAQPVAADYEDDNIEKMSDPFESVFQPDGGEDDDIVEPNVDGGDPQSKAGGTAGGGPDEDEKDPMPNINDAMVDEPETK
jgi:hypothetical protein